MSEPHIEEQLYHHFTFDVPGARFSPKVRFGLWDGKYHLYNKSNKQLYYGLINSLQTFCIENQYQLVYQTEFNNITDISKHELHQFIKSLNLPFEVRDYQFKAVLDGIRNRRNIILSATGSGKSLIIYILARFYHQTLGKKSLIIVPNTNLIKQMEGDFKDYRYKEEIGKIKSGEEKTVEHPITISTWQSIYKLPKQWFNDVGVIIGDEVHGFKAKSLVGIMEKCADVRYRFGLTGSLDDSKTHQLVLTGLYGQINQVSKTSDLIERGDLAKINLNVVILKHLDTNRQKYNKKPDLKVELDFLLNYQERKKFLKNLALSREGNTLLLYHGNDFGVDLHDYIKKFHSKTHLIYGEIDDQKREQIRHLLEKSDGNIVVASYNTFSTGANIKNLHNVILATPSKSKIRILQSLGRGVRLSSTKTDVNVFDIGDDLTYNQKQNYTLRHLLVRLDIYDNENFTYKIYNINLEEK